MVEDLQEGSSPASASTPPYSPMPARLACLKASPLRSTPGPLPYQMPQTPSYLGSGSRLTVWLPMMAVAARSSFTAGMKRMWCSCEQVGDALERKVQRANRRAAVTGDQARCVEPTRPVGAMLIERQPRQRLNPAHDDRAALGGIAVFQGEVREWVWPRRCYRICLFF